MVLVKGSYVVSEVERGKKIVIFEFVLLKW